MRHKNFRRVTFTISTGLVDLQDYNKLWDLLDTDICRYIFIRGCTHLRCTLADANGCGIISFNPHRVDVDILKKQVEQLFDVTVFVEDTANRDEEIDEVKVEDDEE